jgi:glyoxalase family protein
MTLPGIHHVTCICGDVQRNVDFFVGVLGLRFIKQTVNFDVPDTYHLYYGDYVGTPGSAMTYFGWPHLPPGAQGAGQVRHVSFAVPPESLDFWSARLAASGLERARTRRFDTEIITLADPDGIAVELVGDAGDERWQPWNGGPVAPEHQIRSFHSVTLLEQDAEPTLRFLEQVLGFRRTDEDGRRIRLVTGEGGPSAILDVIDDSAARRGREAVGTVHHVAWRVSDDAEQLRWRARVAESGRQVTPVIDRKYFHSIYFREPGGVLFEIATDGPGFTVDEAADRLGSALQLPPQYEERRDSLSHNLPPLSVPGQTP